MPFVVVDWALEEERRAGEARRFGVEGKECGEQGDEVKTKMLFIIERHYASTTVYLDSNT